MKILRKIYKGIALSALVCLLSFNLLISQVSAQYGQGNYGGTGGGNNASQCVYGRTCDPPLQPTDPIPDPTPTLEEPTPEETDEPEELEIIPENNTDDRGPTNTSSTPTRASERIEVKGIRGIVLKQAVDLVEKVPESQRAVVPYYSWGALLIFSFILLVFAIFDRYRSSRISKSVKVLKNVLQEQLNFLRIALHNLNTPLAIYKNAIELLQSTKTNEAKAIAELKPATLLLASVIDHTTSELSEERDSSINMNNQTKITFVSTISQWYFFVPVVIAVLFALLLNWAVTFLGKESRLTDNLFIQVAIGLMICFIFANAIRLLLLSKQQKKLYLQIKALIDQMTTQRNRLIKTIKDSLIKVAEDIKAGIKLVHDKKILKILEDNNKTLESITSKVAMATATTISQPVDVNLKDNIQSILNPHLEEIGKKSIATEFKLKTPNLVKINLKEFDLIFTSILENAIEYSKNDGSIVIGSEIKNKQLVLTVEDNGEGIEKERLDKIFQPFSKTDDALVYNHQGFGLSLYASKSIANRIGGNVTLKSTKNKGTKVTIILPVY